MTIYRRNPVSDLDAAKSHHKNLINTPMTGIEQVLTSAVSGIALPIFQSVYGSGGKFIGSMGKKVHELISRASGEYGKR